MTFEQEEPGTWVPGESESARPVREVPPPDAGGPGVLDSTEPADEPDEQDGEDRDSSSEKPLRRYLVLEESDLAELVQSLLAEQEETSVLEALAGVKVYRNLGEFAARNTEHALRAAARQTYESGGECQLVPLAATMWKPARVSVSSTPKVSIG